MNQYKLHTGSNKDVLKTFEDNSVDSIITDPPYEYGFMGKAWDSTGIAYDVELWKECLRVVKPGGYIMAFGSSRTHHRLMVAIEDAGFEIRDTVCWVFGSGFPKSLNIGKKVDEIQGNEREATENPYPGRNPNGRNKGGKLYGVDNRTEFHMDFSKGTSDFEGWGTALKPAVEYICMARKPLSEKTVAENCLKWGTGGINIDDSRVGTEERTQLSGQAMKSGKSTFVGLPQNERPIGEMQTVKGRFPANLIHDNSEEVRECFPDSKSSDAVRKNKVKTGLKGIYNEYDAQDSFGFNDQGNASRFFKSIIYQAKASKAERNRGCEAVFNLFEQSEGFENKFKAGLSGADREKDAPLDDVSERFRTQPAQNIHTTVKPIALMQYLIKMVTPKGGIVLDPFNGSGSTGCAAVKNGFEYIGIDITPEYIAISNKRIKSYI